MPMNIGEQELKTIGQYVQTHLAEFARNAGITFSDRQVLDRMLVVEQELKTQRELMQQGFEQVDKRIESMQHQMDKRFEQVDKRFESMQQQTDKRFEQVDKRFSATQWFIGIGFTAIVVLMSIYQFVAGP